MRRDRGRCRYRQRLRAEVRLPRSRELRLQVPAWTEPGGGRRDLGPQERAGLDAEVPPQGARVLPGPSDAELGGRPLRHRLREHLLLHQADREAGELLGGPARRTSSRRGTGSASPRRRRSTSPASAPSTSPRSSTTSCRRSSSGRASCSSTWTRACASTRTSSASTSARSSR